MKKWLAVLLLLFAVGCRSKHSVIVSWEPTASCADYYKVWRMEGTTDAKPIFVGYAKTNYFTDTYVKKGATYWYAVSTVCTKPEFQESPLSAPIKAVIPN